MYIDDEVEAMLGKKIVDGGYPVLGIWEILREGEENEGASKRINNKSIIFIILSRII